MYTPPDAPSPADMARSPIDDAALCAAASDGPWFSGTGFGLPPGGAVYRGSPDEPISLMQGSCDVAQTRANLAFAAEARTALPAYIRRAAAAEAEVARLRAIIDTNDLCHNLHGQVDARAFADGCAQEQRKLYGCAPDADAAALHKAEAIAIMNDLRTEQRRATFRDPERIPRLEKALQAARDEAEERQGEVARLRARLAEVEGRVI